MDEKNCAKLAPQDSYQCRYKTVYENVRILTNGWIWDL